MSKIWEACAAQVQPGPLHGRLYRLVESQEQIATTEIVDTLDEQAVLEEMLEGTKPPSPAADDLHYLLRTPFRYPPLPHGSRFGTRTEPSLLYGARGVATMLAEAAFYRLLFWHGMSKPPSGPITTQHTAFTANYRTERGLRLHAPPFDTYRETLVSPSDYSETQALGAAMRCAGVEAFEFRSARDPDGGLNIALFTPLALASRRPLNRDRWVCRTEAARVEFLDEAARAVYDFDLSVFLVDGRLPSAAA